MPVPHLTHRWRQSLPPHPDEHRTGAVWLEEDPQDYRALWLPGIAAHAALGPPADSSLVGLVKEPRLNQGSEGSCVSGSTEGGCQMAHSAIDGGWPAYSIHQLYAEAGGSGTNGVDVRTVMKICIEKGTPLVSGERDSLIKSYVFVDAQPGAFRAQVKAALAAGHPVLVACLLPIPFGWNSGMTLSSAYHQWLAVGVMTGADGKEWVIVLNDWSDAWPGDAPAGTPGGVGRILFDALEQQNGQNGYLYGVIPTMSLVTPPPPPPPPPLLTVTGYAGLATGDTVVGGRPFTILGTGFGAGGPLTVNLGGEPLTVQDRRANQLIVIAPGAGNPGGPVRVQVGDQTATGPPLFITDIPPPPPPPPPPPAKAASVIGHAVAGATNGIWPVVGDALPFGPGVTLTVRAIQFDGDPNPLPPPPPPPPPSSVTVTVASGAHHLLAATVTDSAGAYLAATCAATVPATGQSLGQRLTHPQAPTAIPAVWLTTSLPPGTAVSIRAVTADGRAGTGLGVTT